MDSRDPKTLSLSFLDQAKSDHPILCPFSVTQLFTGDKMPTKVTRQPSLNSSGGGGLCDDLMV